MDKNGPMNIDLHLHTNYTDGEESPAEIMQAAKLAGLQTIALTEHIDKNATYDWYAYRDEVFEAKPKDMQVLIGVEAKVLNDKGELNVNDDIINEADIVLGSVHGKGDVVWLIHSRCDIIAHPQITHDNIDLFKTTNKILEINPKPQYELQIDIVRELVEAGAIFSFGSNTHNKTDLVEGMEYLKNLLLKIPSIKIIGINEKMPDFKSARVA